MAGRASIVRGRLRGANIFRVSTGMKRISKRQRQRHRAPSAVESLESRIQFVALEGMGWAYELPAGNGQVSVRVDIANQDAHLCSGDLRLTLNLSAAPPTELGAPIGIVLADSAPLDRIAPASHAPRTAIKTQFNMDTVQAGTYYLSAQIYEKVSGTYVRQAFVNMEKVTVPGGSFPGMIGSSNDGKISGFDAGDSVTAATPLGSLPADAPLEEIVPSDDDVYRFTVARDSTVKAVMHDPTRTLNLTLLDSTGASLAQGTFGETGTAAELDNTITRAVPAGTYYLQVTATADTNSSQFNLNVSAVADPTTPTPTPGPGPTPTPTPTTPPLSSAVGLGNAPNTQFTDATTADALHDLYQFNAIVPTTVTVKLSDTSADLSMELLNGTGDVVATASPNADGSQSFGRDVGIGSYYIHISGSEASTYTLAVTSTLTPATPTPTPGGGDNGGGTGSGDPFASARDLGASPNTTVTGDVRDDHVSDAFKFTLPARSSVTAVLGNLSTPVEISFLKFSHAPITRTRRSDTAERTLTRTLDAGTYYVLVFRGSGTTTASGYTLALTTTPLGSPGTPPPPGGSDGGVGTGPTAIFKGPKTAKKLYRFTVQYDDVEGIDLATLGPDDILITGPNGFSATASIVRTKVKSRGNRIIATYSIEPPRDFWFVSDNGAYSVSLQPATVSDLAGNTVIGGEIGTFSVNSKKPDPAE